MKISKALKKKIENILDKCIVKGGVYYRIPLHHYGKEYIIAPIIRKNRDGHDYLVSYALYLLDERFSVYNTLITYFTIDEKKFKYIT